LLKRLRADPKTGTIPIILLSAHAGGEGRVEGMRPGANSYLMKSRAPIVSAGRSSPQNVPASPRVSRRAVIQTLISSCVIGMRSIRAAFLESQAIPTNVEFLNGY
jgi:CheY-like chemotaxis protein